MIAALDAEGAVIRARGVAMEAASAILLRASKRAPRHQREHLAERQVQDSAALSARPQRELGDAAINVM